VRACCAQYFIDKEAVMLSKANLTVDLVTAAVTGALVMGSPAFVQGKVVFAPANAVQVDDVGAGASVDPSWRQGDDGGDDQITFGWEMLDPTTTCLDWNSCAIEHPETQKA
jgi:hypothetical protein